MHKGSVRICFAVIIPSLKAGYVPVINDLTFQKTTKHLQIPLVPAFPSSSSLYKNSMLLFTYPLQKTTNLLEILSPAFFWYTERLQVLLIQQGNRVLYVPEHLFFPFSNRFLPHKRIFIGTGFQLRPINKYRFFWQLAHLVQAAHQLIKQVFAGLRQKSCPESGNCAVIRCFLTSQKPHKVDISAAGGFHLSGWINVLRIHIGQDLEHGLWVHCRISAFGRVNLIQQAVI